MRNTLLGRRWLVGSVALMVLFVAGAVPTRAAAPPGPVRRVSVAQDGSPALVDSNPALSCSADGRYVAFSSSAPNVIAGDTNVYNDIFWRDTVTGETRLVSASVDGTFSPQGAVPYCDMTPDGRYVVFYSASDNLVAGDNNVRLDVFRRDMQSGETTLVSTASDGTQGDVSAGDPTISDDGRYVAMWGESTNLVPDDTNGKQDCFVKDLSSGEMTCVSRGFAGDAGNGHSFYASISGNGRKVAFVSYATNLIPGDASSEANLFLRDLDTGVLERIDAKPDGGESSSGTGFVICSLDFTGRHVAFSSAQKDLVSTPVGIQSQTYLRDTVSNETTVVARAFDGDVPNGETYRTGISNDGRYVSFASGATNLVHGDTNGKFDVFMRDMESSSTELLTRNELGQQLNSHTEWSSLSASATAVAFATDAQNILPVAGWTNSSIYVRAFGLDDSRPPTVTADAVASYVGTATISIEATDGPSGTGVDSIQWRLDTAATQTVDADTATVTAGPGVHTLVFCASDLAGNMSEAHEATFTVLAIPTLELQSPNKTLTKWGQSYYVVGIVRGCRGSTAGRVVRLQASASAIGFIDAPEYGSTDASGGFSIKVTPQRTTYYRVAFAGDSANARSTSATYARAIPVAYVGTPHVPSKTSHSKSVSVYGTLKPRHTKGTYPVRIYRWKKARSGSWKRHGGPVKARASNSGAYTKYMCSVRLSTAGAWRIRASAPADSGHALSWSSGFGYVKVK